MLDVLYEDNHLLAVNKPAMLPTMGVAEDRPSLLSVAKEYVRQKLGKPGNVYLGIVSRLDAPVTGVVLMARTSKAAARLTELFRERDVEKTYWALVDGRVDPPSGRLVHYLRKDERHRRMHVTDAVASGAQRAELTYRVLAGCKRRGHKEIGRQGDEEMLVDRLLTQPRSTTWLEVRLLTGRKHQIRVQLADAGWPIVGDRKYGSVRRFPAGIALHSRRLAFMHPVRKEPVTIVASLPPSWIV
jgi:23S rRNA pseudouridine1911/1915/1917 synthase